MTGAKFDPVSAWESLSAEQQTLAGIAAMTAAYARRAAVESDELTGIGFDAAEYHATAALDRLLGMALEAAAPANDTDPVAPPPLPDLAPLGVSACRNCGCTEEFVCPEGCSWIAEGEDLCTACAAKIPAGLPPW